MPRLSRLAALGFAAAAAYPFYEPYRYRLETEVLPVARALPEMTVLHISDTHLNPEDRHLIDFLDRLPGKLGVVPDLILATGDLTEGDASIDVLARCFARLEARLGRFYVLGSHDYFCPSGPSYSKYFTRTKRGPRKATRADSDRLERSLQDKGWISVINRTEHIDTAAGRIRISGVDDPYLGWHQTEHIHSAKDDILAIGVVHAPDVVSEWALHGFDLVVAGHTHGGQVQIPGIGPLVTNSSLPAALASGTSRVGNTWLHVSRGLGTGRFAPIRFRCTPETTLLRLVGVGTR